MIHAILVGPVKDPNRATTGKHGALHVEGTSLRLTLNDGRHVRLTLDGPTDLVELASMLVETTTAKYAAEMLRNLARAITKQQS